MDESQLKAGRELSALVAEKVMKWHKRMFNGEMRWLDENDVPQAWAEQPPPENCDRGWAPDIDIAQAWQVWEKLRASGKWCCLDIKSDNDVCYVIELTPLSLDGTLPHVPTVRIDEGIESASRAICFAALESEGVDISHLK